MRIADDPHRVLRIRQAAGQQRIVCQHRSDADHNPAEVTPQLLDVRSCSLSGDPFGLSRESRDLSIQSHGIFHDNIGRSGPDIVKKHLVGPVTFLSQDALRDLHSVVPEDLNPLAADHRIRIAAAYDHSPDPGFQNRVRAGRLLPVVTAGLQSYIHGRTGRRFRAVLQRVPLCVQISVPLVIPLADHRPVVPDDHGPDHGVGRYPSAALFSQLQRPPHIEFIHFSQFRHALSFPAKKCPVSENLSGSPFFVRNSVRRDRVIAHFSTETGTTVQFLNQGRFI